MATKFADKLNKLLAGRKRAEVARAAQIAPSVLNNYVNRGSEPMAHAAAKIAKVLDVPLGWLLDESADWPPPQNEALTPAQFSDRDLMLEVARRHRLAVLRLLDALDTAEKIEWANPASIGDVQNLATIVIPIHYWAQMSMMFNAEKTAHYNHKILPGGNRPLEDFDLTKIIERVNSIMVTKGYQDAAVRLLVLVPDAELKKIEEELRWNGTRLLEKPAASDSKKVKSPSTSPAPTKSKSPAKRQPKPPSKNSNFDDQKPGYG